MLGALLEVAMSKKCTPLWREARFQVKMYNTPHVRTTFRSEDVEKVHAVVSRSNFPSQNAQNTSFSDHFWKSRCRKSVCRCAAKQISKSKCVKHQYTFWTAFGGSDYRWTDRQIDINSQIVRETAREIDGETDRYIDTDR